MPGMVRLAAGALRIRTWRRPGFFGEYQVFEKFAELAFGFVPGEEFDAGLDGLIELRIGKGLGVIEEASGVEGVGAGEAVVEVHGGISFRG